VARIEESGLIEGVVVVTPDVHGDDRGRFVETYRRSWFSLGREMVQSNRVDRQAGTVVGLHYHLHQADYWYVTRGRARVGLHDLRVGSPTEGASLTLEIGEHDDRGVFIPPGVAHGFAALTDLTLTYLVDGYYNPDDELGVAWDDADIGIDWGVGDPILSARDKGNPRRIDLTDAGRPRAGECPSSRLGLTGRFFELRCRIYRRRNRSGSRAGAGSSDIRSTSRSSSSRNTSRRRPTSRAR